MKLHERVTVETWIQGMAAQADDGREVPNVKSPKAVARCLMGWLERADRLDGELSRVADAARVLFPERMDPAHPTHRDECAVTDFNDHRDTTVEDVRRVLKLADI